MHSNDAQLLVLTALAGGPLHGYAVNTAVEALTGSRLGPGSLYGALARLESRQLIEPVADRDDAGDRHRTLRITEEGREALRAELQRMARVADVGLRRLGASPA